jgi:hypothetical protein
VPQSGTYVAVQLGTFRGWQAALRVEQVGMRKHGRAWQWPLLSCSMALLAIAFVLSWAQSIHRHDTDWFAFGVAMLAAVAATGGLIQWRRTVGDS